jgi:CRP-like cAMP-binding protein
VTGVELATARGNALLDRLGDADLAALLGHAREVELALGSTLHEPGLPVHDVHFPLTGVVSLVTDLGEGEVVEAATVGHEGMAGIAVFLGAGVPTERARVQVAGRAVSLSAQTLSAAAAGDGPLYDTMRRYSQALFTQLARNAGCNRVHLVQQRAARWLLTTADRMHSPTFDITQEFLAQMLAVRRASVGRVARSLAEAGCITYVRGTLTILDRPQLEAYACTCYGVVREAHRQAAAAGATTR